MLWSSLYLKLNTWIVYSKKFDFYLSVITVILIVLVLLTNTNIVTMSSSSLDFYMVPSTSSTNNKNVVPINTLCCTQFSFDSCMLAVKNNHLACLIRAHMAGCPLGKAVVTTAKHLQHVECWKFAKSHVNTKL